MAIENNAVKVNMGYQCQKNKFIDCIESFEDFPKQGVVFWDFTPMLGNPDLFQQAIAEIAGYFSGRGITKIAAIEAKGFIIGCAVACKMGLPLSLVRKPKLIPGEVLSEQFEKEYGFGEYQIAKSSFCKGDVALVVYDILAGGGATLAAISLIEKTGATVAGCAYVTELEYLHGRECLGSYDVFSLVKIPDKNFKLHNNLG